MAEWKDTTNPRQDELCEPRSWTMVLMPAIRICVTRHIYLADDEWLILCDALGIRRQASSSDIDAAKAEAITMVKNRLNEAVAELEQEQPR